MEKIEIIQLVKAAIPGSDVIPEGENCSFSLKVISESFQGQRTVMRQQKVLGAFSAQLRSGALHALSVSAYTPQEWQAYLAKQQPVTIQGL